jgi:hypothetical protein
VRFIEKYNEYDTLRQTDTISDTYKTLEAEMDEQWFMMAKLGLSLAFINFLFHFGYALQELQEYYYARKRDMKIGFFA